MNFTEITEILIVLDIQYWELILSAAFLGSLFIALWKSPEIITAIKSNKNKHK